MNLTEFSVLENIWLEVHQMSNEKRVVVKELTLASTKEKF